MKRLRYRHAGIAGVFTLAWLLAGAAVTVWVDLRLSGSGIRARDWSASIGMLRGLSGPLLALSVVAAACGCALFWTLEHGLREPIRALLRNIRAVREGEEAGRRIESTERLALAPLAEEINAVLDEHDKSRRNLHAYQAEFDRQVAERTRQLDATLAEAQESIKRAQDASRAKSDFLAKMSHEIRTPLNGVLGMADLLQHSPTLDERQRRYAVVIHQSGSALLQLINNLLDFSKIEAGKLELNKERFCLRDMVEDSLEIFAERGQSKGLELICDIPVDLETVVFADCLRLRQVILNLLSNAVKFTQRGDITIKVRAEPGIESSAFTFAVEDTGIGIDPRHRESIFEAFVQSDASTSQRYGGTGLGLAISKQLVELMGGTIQVRSSLGRGSTFGVSLPLAVDRTAPRVKPTSMMATTPVLIVEKSPAGRRMLRQHLKSWGAATTEAASAQDALRRLRNTFSGEFEVLLIDAQLPETTAREFVTAIRAIPEFVDTPIVMMHTGSDDPPDAAALGARVVWQSKPIRRSQLESTLKRLLGLAAARPRPELRLVSSNEARAPSDSKRVLVVEDNQVNREVVGAMLQNLAVQSDMAASGLEALEKFASGSYDAVLMDCQMPDIDGYETTERLRQWERDHCRGRTPVIALTANAGQGDAEKCLACGMDRYMTKPFTIEELRESLSLPAQAFHTDPQPPVPDILDAKTIARIQSLSAGGTPDLLRRLNDAYQSSSCTLVSHLQSAGEARDIAALRRASHALKSSSANVGALPLAATCGELELAIREGQTHQIQSLIERLTVEHRGVLRALRETEVLIGRAVGQGY